MLKFNVLAKIFLFRRGEILFSAELNFKIRLDAKSNVTLKFKKAFWRSVLRCFLLHVVRNAKATNVVQSNFNHD